MCTCLTERKADIARDLAVKHNVLSGVHAVFDTVTNVTKRNKQLRRRVVEMPAVSITATYTKTTVTGKPFKRATVKHITVKPIYCCLCGGAL